MKAQTTIQVGTGDPVARDRPPRQAGRRLDRRPPRRHRRARHGLHAAERHAARLPAAHRRLPRVHLRRRPHPGRLLQARRSADRKGDDHLAPHRPPAAAALPRRLHQRDPGHRPGALGRRRERPRHAGDQRRLRRAGALRDPVLQPDRRRARRPGRRAGRVQPDQQPARRRRPRPRGRRHPGRRGDGRGRRQPALREDAARLHLGRPRRDPEGHPGPDHDVPRARASRSRRGALPSPIRRSSTSEVRGAIHAAAQRRAPHRGQVRAQEGGLGRPEGLPRARSPRTSPEAHAAPRRSSRRSRRRSSTTRSSTTGLRFDGRRLDEVRADRDRGRPPAAHPRLGAVHARRDAGARLGHARHPARRADHRGVRGRDASRSSSSTTTSRPSRSAR